MTYRENLEQRAKEWVESGRSEDKLLGGWTFIKARLWTFTPGANKEGYSKEVSELIEASFDKYGRDSWDDIFTGKDYCYSCGDRYSEENLSLCTNCTLVYCPKCPKNLHHPNGNRSCSCGGEIIG